MSGPGSHFQNSHAKRHSRQDSGAYVQGDEQVDVAPASRQQESPAVQGGMAATDLGWRDQQRGPRLNGGHTPSEGFGEGMCFPRIYARTPYRCPRVLT
jgi:hypothetical protein